MRLEPVVSGSGTIEIFCTCNHDLINFRGLNQLNQHLVA